MIGYMGMRPAGMKLFMTSPDSLLEDQDSQTRGSGPDKGHALQKRWLVRMGSHSIGTRSKAEFCTKNSAASHLSRFRLWRIAVLIVSMA